MHYRFLFLLSFLLPAFSFLSSQTNVMTSKAEERAKTTQENLVMTEATQEVLQPIQKLFKGMLAADTTGLAKLFHTTAAMYTVVTNASGETSLRKTDVGDFIESLSGAKPTQLREELHYTEVRIDGALATAWTPYTFYYQDQISHCGTNAFQLAKTGKDGSWQILRVTDSRNKENCSEKSTVSPVAALDTFATNWHRAAAETEAHIFFGSMADNAVYIGTDAGEHWTKKEFYSFAKPYFDKGKAWDFKAKERHIFVLPNENIAYWDELLDTWMGDCRGTGIVKRKADGSWELLHYTLSVTVANEKIDGFIELTKE